MNTIHVASIEQLRNSAAAWDDLWWRSDVALPLARAETLAQWVEHFHPETEFHALVVEEDGRWITALPLVGRRLGWLLPSGAQPGNAWSPCGEMLRDPTADADKAMDALLAAAAGLRWHLLLLDHAVPETPRWQALLRACQRADVPADYHERFRVGRVKIDGDWDLYQKRLPKNHRQAMNRAARRLACEGELDFEMNLPPGPERIKAWLDEAFEVEDLGWKGSNGSSVFRTPGMFRFFVAQAELLARWGQLRTAALRLDGRIAAFVYGFQAKGIYFALKIGYDPRFSAFSPGQLLFHRLLERLHGDGQTGGLDFIGPLTHSLSRWRPAGYGVGRIVIAPRRFLGRMAIHSYRRFWRRLRQGNPGVPTAAPAREAPATADKPRFLEPAGA
ncbi:MAG: GNAT family N-acetyltransferase [Pirellulales bacterium]|nr:GNAT family N-acetyltransferase [Pirellulales bacterium]